jgi:hypothetical protein
MATYNCIGDSLIVLHVMDAGLLSPHNRGFMAGTACAFAYLLFVWFRLRKVAPDCQKPSRRSAMVSRQCLRFA